MNYKVTYSDEYLMHHGILGQKWGQRNGPPYPLDAEDHSAAEKKAGYKKSIKTKYYESSARASRRDADDLRRNGYLIEAAAVDKVADKQAKKAEKSRLKDEAKYKKKQENKRYSSSELKSIRTDENNYIKNLKQNDTEFSKLNKKYEDLINELEELVDYYGLDGDDGGGGDTSRFSDAELEKAGDKFQEISEQLYNLEESMHNISKSYVEVGSQYIKEKYGDTALRQLNARDSATNIATGAALIAYSAGMIAFPVQTLVGTIAVTTTAAAIQTKRLEKVAEK